mmetsp:Transcript_22540/g.32946  ORF Transcript_22540/g.32946 Transcript_22540/m.32946 type:complete len:433 (-) Transcript_22540:172-1470(-)|eukprot:CAMPEP_0185029628 /NCGR_PEP_ID=MMETSP1103-20130426/16035_1 /TAXON_ID=36769 /ORGANISM="Paraphysomonas bandaiensis, Strain Caron Lab Isolate" /LENGTH=432 /DNA_ID=CAMNT_0027564439 /DNA_START=44 /DNA_END=1345 /DNA_ORIENTATION=-
MSAKVIAPTSWWEEGYDRESSGLKGGEKLETARYDISGHDCELHHLVTDLHHMGGLCLNHSDQFLLLNEPGRGNFQKHSSVSVYEASRDNLLLVRSFQVTDNSGYFSVSCDDALLCIGILKEDSVTVYELASGDLLVNVDGGQKTGFWGDLRFLPGNLNNAMVELRVLDMQKGRAKKSVLRMWDLGFRPESEDDGDEDEEEVKVWEKTKQGAVQYCSCGPELIVATMELSKRIEWIDVPTGGILRSIPCERWVSKAVASPCGKFVAVSHFGRSSVWDVQTGAVAGEVISPLPSSEVYPLTPIRFLGPDSSLLLLRVNQDMSLQVCDWRIPGLTTITVSAVGGTISDGCIAVSRDESLLFCWPFGKLEVYDLAKITASVQARRGVSQRVQLIVFRELVKANRATPKSGCNDSVLLKVVEVESLGVFQAITSYL